jgi:hypothetical protein
MTSSERCLEVVSQEAPSDQAKGVLALRLEEFWPNALGIFGSSERELSFFSVAAGLIRSRNLPSAFRIFAL